MEIIGFSESKYETEQGVDGDQVTGSQHITEGSYTNMD